MARKPRFTATAVGADASVDAAKLYRVRVAMSPHENVRILDPYNLDYCCMPQERGERGGPVLLQAYARGAQVAAMRKAGRRVEVLADALEEGRRMQALVSKTNRFSAAGGGGPQPVGKLI